MSKTSFSFALTALAIVSFTGCGNDHRISSENYSYSMEVNGCKTGEQKADSQTGYCRNLADDAKNNHCAYGMRRDAFEKGCRDSGVAWPSFEFDGVVSPAGETGPSRAADAGTKTTPSSSSSSEETYTYSFTVNGCATGSHAAASKLEYCENLANDELNGDCATDLRKQAFAEACDGTDARWTSPDLVFSGDGSTGD